MTVALTVWASHLQLDFSRCNVNEHVAVGVGASILGAGRRGVHVTMVAQHDSGLLSNNQKLKHAQADIHDWHQEYMFLCTLADMFCKKKKNYISYIWHASLFFRCFRWSKAFNLGFHRSWNDVDLQKTTTKVTKRARSWEHIGNWIEFIIFEDSPTGKNPDRGGLHREAVRK